MFCYVYLFNFLCRQRVDENLQQSNEVLQNDVYLDATVANTIKNINTILTSDLPEPLVPETMLKDVLFWALDNNDKPTREYKEPPKDNILHYACKKGYLPVVKMLVEDRKMSLIDPGENNVKPIQMAADAGNLDLVRYLINLPVVKSSVEDRKMPCNTPGEDNVRPTQVAFENKEPMVPESMLKDILFWALDNNNKPTRANNEPPKDNILHYACKKGYLPVVKMLLEDRKMPYNLNAPGGNNLWPTQLAIESRNVELVKYLKSKGSTICISYAKQLVQNMLWQTDTSLAEFLLECNILCANCQWANGKNNILHCIVQQCLGGKDKVSNTNLAKLLFENGSCPSKKNSQGKTSLDLAVELNNIPMVKMILEYFGNHKVIPNHECLCQNEKIIFRTKRSKYLFQAVKNKNTEIVDILIKRGAYVNIRNFHTKRAPIHEANDKIAEVLIANGANIDIQDPQYETALHIAAKNGDKEKALILLRNGANTELENKNGKTAQEIANENQHFDIAEMIIRERTMKKIQQKFNIVSKSNPFKSIDLGNSIEVLKDAKCVPKISKENDSCSVCFEPKNGVFAFQPCGHANACEECCVRITFSEDQQKCPICRSDVRSFQRIYV